MIATGEIIQIKSYLSVPYSSITQADIAANSIQDGKQSPGQSMQNASQALLSAAASTSKHAIAAQASSTASSNNASNAAALGAKSNRNHMKKRGRPSNGIKKDKSKREHNKLSRMSSGLVTPSRV